MYVEFWAFSVIINWWYYLMLIYTLPFMIWYVWHCLLGSGLVVLTVILSVCVTWFLIVCREIFGMCSICVETREIFCMYCFVVCVEKNYWYLYVYVR